MPGDSTTRWIFEEVLQEGFFCLRGEGNEGLGRSIVHNASTSSSVVERGEAAIDGTSTGGVPIRNPRLAAYYP